MESFTLTELNALSEAITAKIEWTNRLLKHKDCTSMQKQTIEERLQALESAKNKIREFLTS